MAGLPLTPHSLLKYVNFEKNRTLFPESHIFLVSTDDSVKGRLYDMHAMHGKISGGPRITKSLCSKA